MEKTIEKRNEVRISYQIEIINLLRKGKRTITEIAKILGVSFTAISRIVDELVKTKLLKYSNKKQIKTRGRNPSFVELNCDDGVVCSIDCSSFDVRVILASLDNSVIVEDCIPDVKYMDKELIRQLEIIIKTLLEKPEVNNRKLLSICISSPGLIRPDSFEYVTSRRLKESTIVNPVSYLSNVFNVNVEMHNDVRLGCLAELKFGSFPKRPFNGLFIHVSFAAGLALVFNGKIYKGSHNFSGETPVYIGNDDITKESQWNARFFSIWEINQAIKRYKNLPVEPFNEFVDLEKIIEDYKNGDPQTVRAVEVSAKRNAITIFGLATILDIDYVVIEGRVLDFGQEYLDLIRKDIDDFSVSDIRTRILTSGLKDVGCAMGAVYQACSMYFRDTIENSTRERFNVTNFVLEEKYRDL
ncbi:MAG: ROK family transcriptional regulator [Bacilli bacterium]|jgi:predicted NBD/HSP70 family sugar kinase